MTNSALFGAPFALFLCSTSVVMAANVDETIVIVGSRSAAAISEIGGSVTRIDEQTMKKHMANNLQDAIQAEPGVYMAGIGKFGLGSFNIRGMQDDRVKIMIDGVEQPLFFKAGSGSPHTSVINQYANNIELDTLTAIEINKNAASSLYGSDAIGGAVMLRTKNPDDLLQGNERALIISGGYSGENHGIKTTWESAYDASGWQGMAIYTLRDSQETLTHKDGIDVVGVTRGRADPADYLSHNLLLKGIAQLDEQQLSLTVEMFKLDGESELLSMEGYRVEGRRGAPDTVYSQNSLDSHQQRLRLTASHEWQADMAWFDSSQLQLSWQQAHTDNDNYRTKNTDCLQGCVLVRNRKDNNLQLHSQFDKFLSYSTMTQQLSYGLSVVRSEFNTFYEDIELQSGLHSDSTTLMPNATSLRTGLFFKQRLNIDSLPLHWDFGVRFDDHQAEPDGDLASHHSNAVTFNTGVVYRVNYALSTYATVNSGYRAPSLYDLYYQLELPHVILDANPNLDAEYSVNYELGLRYFSSRLSAELALFNNDFRDFIDTVVDDSAYPSHQQYQNVGRAKIQGIELKAELALEPLLPGSYLSMGLAWADGENLSTQRPLDSVAPFNASMTLGFDSDSSEWGALLFAKYADHKAADDWSSPDNLTAPAYLTLDLQGYWQVSTQCRLQLGLNNLTDEQYWLFGNVAGLKADAQLNIDRYSQPGRHINATVNYRF